MAIFHMATNTPPKSEIIAAWLYEQPWGPATGAPIDLVASFHLDDPDGQVGMQVFIVNVAGVLHQVPLTYRAAAVPELEPAFIATMEHSMLGTRYLYDGLADERFVLVLAGVAACGYGQALGFANYDGRWHAVPDQVLIQGTGAIGGRVAIDGFERSHGDGDTVVMANERLELTFFRSLGERPLPAIGLTGTWAGQPTPLSLLELRER